MPADATLRTAVRLWFALAVAGQLIFVLYILLFYGRAAAAGDFLGWNKVLAQGYTPGRTLSNTALAFHLLFAATITASGALQLIPRIRTRFPAFHRWVGRFYVVTAFTMAITGVYLVWTGEKVVGDTSQHVAITLNAVLIAVCAGLAWRYAVAREFRTHRRWALRLFMVVNGVWFFRVGLMFWLMLNHGPVGFNPKTFQGPALTFLSFAQYLLPLGVLELYFRTQQRPDASSRFLLAASLFVLTVAMGLGIFAATMGLWLPRI